MGLIRSKERTETGRLADTRAGLPRNVADWTPAQRQQYATQSDRAMREQAGIDTED